MSVEFDLECGLLVVIHDQEWWFVSKMQRRPSELGKELEELSERGTAEWAKIKSHGITQPSKNKCGREMTAVSKEQRKRTERTTVTKEMCYELITYKSSLEKQKLQMKKDQKSTF